jgi:hypothetical protein
MKKVREVTATQLSSDSVRIDWLPVRNAPNGYDVLRGRGHISGDPPEGTPVVAHNVVGTSFVDDDLPSADVTYWVGVAV